MLTLTAEQVLTLAPDAAAARSGEALGGRRRWTGAGRTDVAAWGLCQGSGSTPYQVAVDLSGPAYKCSRTAAAATRAERAPEIDPEARAKRVASRERKVAAGIEELDRWLRDLMRRGLDSTRSEGYRFWDAMGARLVDAQAGGLGRSVRGLASAANSGALRDVVIAVDQSGSMAASVVYSSVFAAVMASIRSVETKLVVFDTSVVDLTDLLDDPVEVLFSTRLGGGTDINRAVGYCQSLVARPADTIFVLISDLFEGGVEQELIARVSQLLAAGVTVIVLLALSDKGAPSFDHELAAKLAALGAPAFPCTPDHFPGLIAAPSRNATLAAGQQSRGSPSSARRTRDDRTKPVRPRVCGRF